MRLPDLLRGRLVRRYKRFFADVELEGGQLVVAHCPNPGSMKTCAPDGARVWVSEATSPTRALRYTWELVEVDGALVCVNTARANQVVAEALAKGGVAELRGWGAGRREVRYGERSRVDFLLARGRRACYVEVKSVTLDLGDRIAGFPDSVTERGRRHLEELMGVAAAGDRAVMLFSVNRSNARRLRPADDIDPRYGAALRQAAASGVELLAYRSQLSPRSISLRQPIPIDL